MIGVIQRFPEYLKQVNYRNPDSTVQPGPFQYCLDTDQTTFEWIGQHPETASDFNLFMTQHRPQDWTETFSVPDNLLAGVTINDHAPLVVDVAGGYGHDLRRVKSRVPASLLRKGRFVLEDQASVIDMVPEDLRDADIEYVKHDFFTAQPVKGARLYTLKSILHDWADDKAVAILKHIAAAMQPGYSKIWILDGIVPETKANLGLVGMDITMMIFLCALERSVKQWEALLDQAGLVISGLHERSDGFGVVEAMLK